LVESDQVRNKLHVNTSQHCSGIKPISDALRYQNTLTLWKTQQRPSL